MKLALMQPYFLPYIGYFQLINSVDTFVVYDDVNYIKSGYINRNRLLHNGEPKFFTINLDKASSFKLINETFILDNGITKTREKNLNMFKVAYKNAPYFNEVFALLEKIILCKEDNIALFNLNALKVIMEYLNIDTEIVLASDYPVKEYSSEERVIHICNYFKADTYVNSIGGKELYSTENFKAKGVELYFIKNEYNDTYQQFDNEFVPNLSIIDVLMFNSKEEVKEMLNKYSLVR